MQITSLLLTYCDSLKQKARTALNVRSQFPVGKLYREAHEAWLHSKGRFTLRNTVRSDHMESGTGENRLHAIQREHLQ